VLGGLALAAGAMLAHPAAAGDDEPSRKVNFNFQVRPILSDKCFNCHAPDPRMRKAGLRLDTKEGAFGTNKSGNRAADPALDPAGCAAMTVLAQAILNHDEVVTKR
jgi:Planctomycete cytochrome C